MFFFSRRRGFLVFGLAMVGPLLPLLALLPLDPHGLLGALAGAGVGVRSLPAHGKAPAVPNPLVRADLDLALDVLGHVAAKVPLDLVIAVDPVADPDDLLLGQVPDLPAAVQAQALH